MDLRASNNARFDAFKGNSLVKASSSRSRSAFRSGDSTKSSRMSSNYNFDELWRGSVSNLMSSENITEDLIKETIKELECAMQESKQMLSERDEEILKLREYIENNKQRDGEPEENLIVVKEQLEETQRHIVELECETSELKIKHVREIENLKKLIPPPSQPNSSQNTNDIPECTCYCGAACKAVYELYEAKGSIEAMRLKYENLKRRVREFKRHAEENQKNVTRMDFDEEKTTNCTIQ